MISLSKNFVFVHIPKTGGTSIEEALAPFEFLPQLAADHSNARHCRAVLGDRWSRFFKFSFVRNPWSLCVSHWHYRTQMLARKDSLSALDPREWDFARFMREVVLPSEHCQDFENQIRYIEEADASKIIIDQVYRFEDLEGAWQDLRSRLAIQVPETLPHFNKSKRRGDWRDLYDQPDLIDIVAQRFSRDIEVFGYTFEPEKKACAPEKESPPSKS